ncbi:unnamed protein product, partial [Lampetra fluviatilis]
SRAPLRSTVSRVPPSSSSATRPLPLGWWHLWQIRSLRPSPIKVCSCARSCSRAPAWRGGAGGGGGGGGRGPPTPSCTAGPGTRHRGSPAWWRWSRRSQRHRRRYRHTGRRTR